MTQDEIQSALGRIRAETDPTVKHLMLASLVSALFQIRGIQLVVVGGSAIEFYTEGAYVSGDLDLCVASSTSPLTVRLRQELMAPLGALGGPRSWRIANSYVDVLGTFENLSQSPVRRLRGPFGDIQVSPVEELIVERILVSRYPQDYPPALHCARKLLAAALQGEVETDWAEVKRLAESSAYQNWNEVQQNVHEQSQALSIRSPYDSHE